MLAPTSVPRRNPYLWTRFTTERVQPLPITLSERVSVPVLRTLLDMHADLPCINTNRQSLENYLHLARDQHGSVKAVYTQKDLTPYAPATYRGSTRIGRAYPTNTATFFPKPIISTLFGSTHVELDMMASYPSMLVAAFGAMGVPALERYVASPLSVMNEFAHIHGVSRNDIKKLVNTMICSAPSYPADFGLGFADEGKIREISETVFVRDLVRDLSSIGTYLNQHYPDYLEMIKTRCEQHTDINKRRHVIGCALSYMCGDMEQVVMRCVIGFLAEQDRSGINEVLNNLVWKFDGLLVPRGLLAEDDLDAISRRVKDKTGLTARFRLKDLDGGIRLAISDEELRQLDKYEVWKGEFEKRIFRLVNPAVYCYVHDDGTIQDLTEQGFKHVTMEENKDFIGQWKVDPNKRMYICKDFRPFPLYCSPDHYNLYRGLAAASLDVDTTNVDIQPYLKHVHLLSGSVTEYADYIHKLIAYKIQNPGLIWRVMIFIRSTQGVGKDIWFEFLMAMLGQAQTIRLTKIGEITDKCSHLLEGRLLVGFSEMDARDCRENMEELKNFITSTQVVVKKKYVSEYKITSAACFIGFSNNYNAVKISADDRRFFAVTADGRHANDAAYHKPLVEYFGRKEVQRAVYNYYMDMDLGNFDPSGDRVTTDTMKSMRADSLSGFDVLLKSNWNFWKQECEYIRYGIMRIKLRTVYDHFAVVVRELKYQDCDSNRRMDLLCKRLMEECSSRMERFRIHHLERQSVITSKRSHSVWYLEFDVDAVEKYLRELGGDEDGNGEDAMEVDQPVVLNPFLGVQIPNFSATHEYENDRGAYAAGFVPGN